MASEPPPLQPSTPPGQPMERLGVGGLVLGISALVGVIASFLPLVSVSTSAGGFGAGMSMSGSGGHVVNDWRGVIDLVCYIGIIVVVVMLAVGNRSAARGLCWGAIGASGAAVLMALLLLIAAFSSIEMFGASIKSSPAIGTWINFLASLGAGAGAVLKAREEKLF